MSFQPLPETGGVFYCVHPARRTLSIYCGFTAGSLRVEIAGNKH